VAGATQEFTLQFEEGGVIIEQEDICHGVWV
jgi:hypothetical protein